MNGNRTFKLFGGWVMLALFIVLPPAFAVAQDSRPPKVPDYGYADSIFINGKIVSLKIGRLTDFFVLDKDFSPCL